MNNTLEARVLEVKPPVRKAGAKGLTTYCDFVVEQEGPYPKKLKLRAFNDEAEKVQVADLGDRCQLHLRIESREYMGKWYTDVLCQKFYNLSQ